MRDVECFFIDEKKWVSYYRVANLKRKTNRNLNECNPDTPPCNVIGDYRCSVHYNNTYRLTKAKEQAIISTVDDEIIISYVNEFFRAIGMNTVESPKIHNPQQIDYKRRLVA